MLAGIAVFFVVSTNLVLGRESPGTDWESARKPLIPLWRISLFLVSTSSASSTLHHRVVRATQPHA